MSTFAQAPVNKSRVDKFIMVIPVPTGLKTVNSHTIRNNQTIVADSLTMSVFGGIVPDISVPAIQERYAGQTLYATSHTRDPYPPLSVKFTIDNRFNNYWTIYKWLNILNHDQESIYDQPNVTGVVKVHDENTKTLISTTDHALQKYTTTVSIIALDEYNKPVIEFKYTRAFPIKLGGITYNYRDATEIEVSAEFAYSQMVPHLVEDIS